LAKSTGKELATKPEAEIALSAQADLEAQLAGENQDQVDASDYQIPLLKIGQALTAEVIDGEARPGEFINSLTREGLGTDIEFVVAAKTKGRFDHGDRQKGERARKAYGIKTVPWAGDPFYGLPFTEHPDAEEQFAARVNAGEIEWGKGPRISTTYDFYGHVVSGLAEDEDPIPVCLSLMRLNKNQAKKWVTILDAVLRGRYWDRVFTLTTEQQRGEQGNFYTINIKQGRKTEAFEKQRATGLALAVKHQNINVVGDDESAPGATAEPAAAGGLEI
jgi:hypothetical protein